LSNANSVAAYWDQFVGTHLNSPDHWEANQVVQQAQWRFVTGDPFLNPVDWFIRKFGPFTTMASICSGSGILERHVAKNYLRHGEGRIDGYDISSGSLALARENALGIKGVYYNVADVNSANFEPAYLDAVFAHGALHHVRNLDHCLGQIRRALKPTGYLYVNDYVGPRRFQWTDVQVRLATELLQFVPPRFLRNTEVVRCDPVALNDMDPSEAVRSDHIMDHIHAHFEVVIRLDRGGTLLAPIFGSGCISPAVFEHEDGMNVISHLCTAERAMIDAGIIPSNHMVVVATPRR
jgi:SAM-dependent methyltransferase